MTTNFRERADDALAKETGWLSPYIRSLSLRQQGDLASHQHWVRSRGRFGEPLTWKGERAAFLGRRCEAEDFAQVTLIDCTLRWSDFRFASFAGATLKNVKFENCDVEECDFRGAQLENVAFTNCFDMDKAKFEGAIFFPSGRNDPPGGCNQENAPKPG
jgi:hypothetical protein